jgi:hypothetical protein
MRCCLAFLICIFLICCKGEFSEKTSIPVVELTAKQYFSDSVYFRYPFRVRLNNDTLYVMDLHGVDFYVHAFAFPQMRKLFSYGIRGNGPTEFLDCENIRLDAKGFLWLLDANKKMLVCVSDTGQREIPLNRSLIRTLDFDFYNDSVFIVPDYTGKHRYMLIDSNGNIVSGRGVIPKSKKSRNQTDIALAQAWRSFTDYNSKSGILAMVTQLGEVVELYDVKHDKLVRTIYGEAGEPEYQANDGMAIPKGIMGYSDVQVESTYIYALFWGQSFKDIQQNRVKHEGGNRIDVFDLKGNLIRYYRLDRNVVGFQVDEKRHLLIALDPNSDQPVVSYNI